MGKFKVKFGCNVTIHISLTGSILAEDSENAYYKMSSNAYNLFRLESIDIDKGNLVQLIRETGINIDDRDDIEITEVEDDVMINCL